jgi:hypothetical protein
MNRHPSHILKEDKLHLPFYSVSTLEKIGNYNHTDRNEEELTC